MSNKKKFDTILDFCVSSLRRGHANLLCIVPILTDVSRRSSGRSGITITSYIPSFKTIVLWWAAICILKWNKSFKQVHPAQEWLVKISALCASTALSCSYEQKAVLESYQSFRPSLHCSDQHSSYSCEQKVDVESYQNSHKASAVVYMPSRYHLVGKITECRTRLKRDWVSRGWLGFEQWQEVACDHTALLREQSIWCGLGHSPWCNQNHL